MHCNACTDYFLSRKKGDNAKWKHGGQGEADHKTDDKGWKVDAKKVNVPHIQAVKTKTTRGTVRRKGKMLTRHTTKDGRLT